MRVTSGTSDVLTTIIMAAKNGCVTTFSNRNTCLTKERLFATISSVTLHNTC